MHWSYCTLALSHRFVVYSLIYLYHYLYVPTHLFWIYKFDNHLKWSTLCQLSPLLSSSSWPGDVIWWHASGSTLDQIVVCCLVAPSHYLNQWWPIITDGNFTENVYSSGNETTDILYRPQCVKLNVVSVPWSLLLLRSKFMIHITVCCIRLCMRVTCSALTLGHPQTRQKISQIYQLNMNLLNSTTGHHMNQ